MPGDRRVNVENIVMRIARCMVNEDRKDTEFRTIITWTEFGDFFEYVMADTKKRGRARQHKPSQDEILAAGQMLIQLGAIIGLRGINLKEVIESAVASRRASRKASALRVALNATALFADASKYITHDAKLNPGARPHGTPEKEVSVYKDLMNDLFVLIEATEIRVEDAFELGLREWEEFGWRKRVAKGQGNELRGIGVTPGSVRGTVYLISDQNPIEQAPPGSILVAPSTEKELALFLDNVVGVITDHGGGMSHAAIIVRERGGVVCAVGTGKATEILKHGQEIILTVAKEGHDAEVKFEMV